MDSLLEKRVYLVGLFLVVPGPAAAIAGERERRTWEALLAVLLATALPGRGQCPVAVGALPQRAAVALSAYGSRP